MGTFRDVMGSSHKIDIGGLLAGGRQRMLVDQEVRFEPFEGHSFPHPGRVKLELQAIDRMLEIVGTIDVEAHGECDRCLGDVVRQMHVDVDEQLEPERDARVDPFGESNVLTGDRLDVVDLASQLVYSALPLGVLCGEDCQGLCDICGQNKNTGACTCEPELETTSGES
ncbi:MAG: YceD family protein [Vulcanimicrobiaceae bacterium]